MENIEGHDGHRQRLMEKLDFGVLEDHELLEILLFYAIPRKNTNTVAHELLNSFGSLYGVFNASETELEKIGGIGKNSAAFITVLGKLYRKCEAIKYLKHLPEYFFPNDFRIYIASEYKKEEKEVLDFYFLDDQAKILSRKRFTEGESYRVRVEPAEFTAILVQKKPKGLVVVHNHINPNCFPTVEDDKTTAMIQMICSIHNTRLYDHYIYSPAGIFSYHDMNRMQEISKRFSIGGLFNEDINF